MEVKPFSVLTGPQSVGKSTTAKLLYFFKSIPAQIRNAAIAFTFGHPHGDVPQKVFLDSLFTEEFLRTHAPGGTGHRSVIN